jgi:hypothetical protein
MKTIASPVVAERASSAFVIATAMLVAALASWALLAATPFGLGMTPDSVQYLQSARSLSDGRGLVEFSSHWPPGYPIAIASATAIGGDAFASSRWLNVAALVASLVLLAALARQCRWPVLAIAALLALSLRPGFLHVHYLMWSEPLFVALVLGNLLVLHQVLSRHSTGVTWTLLAGIASAAIVVRYAGAFLLLVNAIALLRLDVRRPLRVRWAATAAVTVASLVPLLAWIAFNQSRGSGAVNRALAWHPPGTEHFASLQATVSEWFLLPLSLGVPALAALALMSVYWGVRPGRSDPGSPVAIRLIALAILAYAVFLLVSITLIDHHTPLDDRILFPLFPLCWILLIHTLLAIKGRIARGFAWLLILVQVAAGTWHGTVDWRATRDHGLGLTRHAIREMPVLTWMRGLPPNIPAITNGPELCTIYLDRTCAMLPRSFDPTSLEPDPDAALEFDRISEGPTIVVHFQVMAYRRYLPGPAELEKFSAMRLVYRGPDASAWVRHPELPVR